MHATFAGCGLFLLVGEVGLNSGGGANEPSKFDEYMVVNRSLFALELGRAGNTLDDAVCFPRMTFADLALSRASFTTASLSANIATVSGPGGVNLAFAERERGLSRVPGRCFKSAITTLFDVSLPMSRERAASRTIALGYVYYWEHMTLKSAHVSLTWLPSRPEDSSVNS